jgi:uroporphyrinogen decarboxylase
MEMNSRERVMAALRREVPDRVPYVEIGIDQSLAEQLMGWPKSGSATSGSLLKHPYTVDQAKALSRKLGIDNLYFILRAPDYSILGTGKDGRTFPVDGRIKTEEDFELIRLPDPTKDELYADAETFLKGKEDFACCLLTRAGLTQTYLGMGMDTFFMALHDNRPLVEKMLDLYFDWTCAMADRACQMGFDFFMTTDDFAFKTGLFFSPKLFHELLVPRYRRLASRLTIPWALHCDGNIEPVLGTLIDLGVVATHPNETGAMDIRAVKRAYGNRLCLLGNVDLVLLGNGTPGQVDVEVRGLIRDLGPGGGYMISSGNSLASYLKPECVLAMAEAIRKYGRYPIDLG